MRKEIVELRKLIAEEGIDAYFVPSGDFHGSEYVNKYFRMRAFLSGFTGSAGELLVTADGAWLWTDGRYYIQAEKELCEGVSLYRASEKETVKIYLYLIIYMEFLIIKLQTYLLMRSVQHLICGG